MTRTTLAILLVLSSSAACHPPPRTQAPPIIRAPEEPARGPVRFTYSVEVARGAAGSAPRPAGPGEALAGGDRLALKITPQQRAFLYVLHTGRDGQTSLLYPGPQDPPGPQPGGVEARLPPAEEWFEVEPGAGAHALHLVSSATPLTEAWLQARVPAAEDALAAAPPPPPPAEAPMASAGAPAVKSRPARRRPIRPAAPIGPPSPGILLPPPQAVQDDNRGKAEAPERLDEERGGVRRIRDADVRLLTEGVLARRFRFHVMP